ncbi:MAG TPA: polysaccharide deacetylase family protein [Solirubrobacteraceae bacterium]|nr:polysaccharide deacetylase family protein [Solirubrobacteraceae bacterium]
MPLLVLCYHAISPDWPAALSTTQERFAEQLGLLAARGYRGVTFTEAVDRRDKVRRDRDRLVAVTFDDAFASVAELARPVLDDLGWPATLYVPTDFPGERRPLAWSGTDHWLQGPHAHELTPLGWDGLRGLRDAGWELGSHTCSHPRLTTLDDAELARELTESRAVCERELGDCPSLAYPYGDVDGRVVAAAEAAGYRTAAALPPQPHRGEPLRWPRVGVYRVDDARRFRLKANRALQLLRGGSRRPPR